MLRPRPLASSHPTRVARRFSWRQLLRLSPLTICLFALFSLGALSLVQPASHATMPARTRSADAPPPERGGELLSTSAPEELPAPRPEVAKEESDGKPATTGSPQAKAESPYEDILRLRRAFGSPFEGTLWENEAPESAEDAFAAALDEVARQMPPTAPQNLPPPAEALSYSPYDACVPSEPSSPVLGEDVRAELRRVARQVDRLADQLEELEACYEEADQLRAVADQLRLRAR